MLNSKVAIVTGADQGIGAGIARYLLSLGWRVVIADIQQKSFSYADPSQFLFVKTDVRHENSVKHLIKSTIDHFGRIDAVVNNAGLLPDEEQKISFEKTSFEMWSNFLATNLTGAFLVSRDAAPYLKKVRGNIVNIASTRALMSEGHHEGYAATKAGLVGLTHEMAISLGPDVRVNCVSPGWINSHNETMAKRSHDIHPVGRLGEPKDIAYIVEFLLSEKSGFTTGQNFIVDGGMTVKMIY